MKRITVLFFFLLSIFYTYGQEVTIGTGTRSDRNPMGALYGFERSAALYTAAEINQVGFINKLAWDIGSVKQERPIKIYLKEVDNATLVANNWNSFIADATLVYEGIARPVTTGYYTIAFLNSFNYSDGTKNLLVLVETNYGGSGGGSSFDIKATEATNMHFTKGKDNTAPTEDLSAVTSRPNLKITFGNQITCPQVTGTIQGISSTSVNFTISDQPTTESIEYEVRTSGEPGSGATGLAVSGTLTDISTQPLVIDGLTESTSYSLYLRANCGAEGTSFYTYAGQFTTSQVPATLPFNENFEGSVNWQMGTGSTNKWFIGDVVNNGGTKALYISKDEGVSYEYDRSASSVTHAYRDLAIPANTDELSIGFDWKAVGEGSSTQYDYFRVWIVPSTYTPVTNTQITAAPNRMQLGGNYNLTPEFTRATIEQNIAAFAGQNVRLVFEWRNDGSGGDQPPAAIDNIEVKQVLCSLPSNLIVDALTKNSIKVSWGEIANASSYDVFLSTDATQPDESATVVNVTAATHTFTNLEPNTIYYIWVRSRCSDNAESTWTTALEARTPLVPKALPYAEDFEGDISFGYINDTTNKWVVGTAVNNGGTNALYISNDDGVTNEYTVSGAQVSHVFQDFEIPQDVNELSIRFDWRCVGETVSFDRFKVWAVPVDFLPIAGTQITADAGRIQLGRENYNGNNAFLAENLIVDATSFAGQTMRLVFEWRQDSSGGTQPPAAIDNLNVEVITCSQPSNLVLEGVTSNNLTASWGAIASAASYEVYIGTDATPPGATVTTVNVTGTTHIFEGLQPNTTYYVWVRTKCSATEVSLWTGPLQARTSLVPVGLPYEDDFETDQPYAMVNDNLNKWFIGNAVNNGGDKALYITSDDGVTNAYIKDDISQVSQIYKDFTIPAGATDIEITFDWRCVGESSFDYFRVWAVPTTYFPTANVLTTATNSSGVQLGRTNFSQNDSFLNERLVFDATAYAGQTLRLLFEWRNDASGGTQPPAAIDNLKLKQITCPTVDPTTITIGSITRNSAVVSWTAVTGISSYDVYHNTTGVRPDETTTPTATVNGTTHTLNNLADGTQFFVWVRSHCSATDTGYWEGPISFSTDLIPVDLPYFEDFNDNPKFGYVNDSKNKWVVGQANNIAGEAMYISKDNGVSNSYEVSGAQVSHIYKDIIFPANATEVYTMSFNWRAVGESTYDYFRVWLVPTTYVPVAGVQTTAANSGGVQLGQNIYNLTPAFTPERIDFDATPYAGQTMRVIFEWRQDGGGGAQPPAAIKNLYIQHVACGDIEEIVIEKIDNTEDFHISWTPAGDETKWEIFIVEIGESDPLYTTQGIVVEGTPEYIFEDAVEEVFYRVYVRAICSDTEKGFWVGPEQFSVFYPPGCANIDVEELDIEIADDGNYYLCTDEPVTLDLKANFYDIRATTEYEVESIDYDPPFPFVGGDAISLTRDDYWSDIIDLGFDFCFFGNSYDKVLIGTNGMLTFSIAGEVDNGRYQPLAPTGYLFNDTHQIPMDRGGTTSPPYVNSIFGVMQDMYPDNSPSDYSVNYQILGTAPCRALVFNMYHMGLFGSDCPYDPSDIEGSTQTTQVVLYEGTNIIEVYVKNRKACTGFNNGSGLIGIQNEDGTQGYAPPGRNSGPWDAQNEAWRFVPSGPSIATFQWLKDGVFYSDQTDISVTIEESVVYTGKISYTHCNGEELEIKKNFSFLKEPFNLSTPQTLYDCAKKPGSEYVYNLDDNIPVVLQGLNIEEFTVEYFTSKADLDAGINSIDPSFVTENPEGVIIYMKVTNKLTKCPKDTSFRLGKNEQLGATQIEPIFICKEVVLPKLADGEAYYTDPYGAGTKYEAGALYNVVGKNTLYVYREDENGCYGQSEFTIEILP
ncbi:fibronectin type III domain-containing protein, partial [Myroides sp. C8-3]